MFAVIAVIILILVAMFAGIWTAVGLGVLGFIILAILGMANQ